MKGEHLGRLGLLGLAIPFFFRMARLAKMNAVCVDDQVPETVRNRKELKGSKSQEID